MTRLSCNSLGPTYRYNGNGPRIAITPAIGTASYGIYDGNGLCPSKPVSAVSSDFM